MHGGLLYMAFSLSTAGTFIGCNVGISLTGGMRFDLWDAYATYGMHSTS